MDPCGACSFITLKWTKLALWGQLNVPSRIFFFSRPWGKKIKVELLPALVRETTLDKLETGYRPDTQHWAILCFMNSWDLDWLPFPLSNNFLVFVCSNKTNCMFTFGEKLGEFVLEPNDFDSKLFSFLKAFTQCSRFCSRLNALDFFPCE